MEKILAVIATTTDLTKLRQILTNAVRLHGESHVVAQQARARLASLQKVTTRAPLNQAPRNSALGDTRSSAEVVRYRDDLERLAQTNDHKPGYREQAMRCLATFDSIVTTEGPTVSVSDLDKVAQEYRLLYRDADQRFKQKRDAVTQHQRAVVYTTAIRLRNILWHGIFITGLTRKDTATSPAVAAAIANWPPKPHFVSEPARWQELQNTTPEEEE